MNRQYIMLIEDNKDDIELTLHSFKKNNIANEIVVMHDGIEALDYLLGKGRYSERNVQNTPSLILLDLKLPKLSGIEVLKQLRANELTELVPVIILTSSKEEQDIYNSYKSGCNSYIRKPVVFTDFSEAVKQLGLYWLVLNESPLKNRK